MQRRWSLFGGGNRSQSRVTLGRSPHPRLLACMRRSTCLFDTIIQVCDAFLQHVLLRYLLVSGLSSIRSSYLKPTISKTERAAHCDADFLASGEPFSALSKQEMSKSQNESVSMPLGIATPLPCTGFAIVRPSCPVAATVPTC